MVLAPTIPAPVGANIDRYVYTTIPITAIVGASQGRTGSHQPRTPHPVSQHHYVIVIAKSAKALAVLTTLFSTLIFLVGIAIKAFLGSPPSRRRNISHACCTSRSLSLYSAIAFCRSASAFCRLSAQTACFLLLLVLGQRVFFALEGRYTASLSHYGSHRR